MFKEMFDNISKQAEQAIPFLPTDYLGEDGLMYCGKCHTAKECIVNFNGESRKQRCMCNCMVEEERLLQAENEASQTETIYRNIAFKDEKLKKFTFENDDNADKRITEICKRYCQQFELMSKRGKGLILFGDTGCGKTYMTCCIINELVKKGEKCKFTSCAEIANDLTATFDKEAVYDDLDKFDLIVLDDLSAERQTEFMQEAIYNIIDRREKSGKPLLISTNTSIEEFKAPKNVFDKRVYSRLYSMCIPVQMKGKDRRRENLIKEYGEYKDMLGI